MQRWEYGREEIETTDGALRRKVDMRSEARKPEAFTVHLNF